LIFKIWIANWKTKDPAPQDNPGGKDGRCVRLTTYHLQVSMSRKLEALTSQNTLGPIGL
jgi:hypothetical protein